MKLFGHPDSGHAYKVRLMLVLADIKHEYEVVDIFSPRESRSEEFRENTRYGEVPLLLDDNKSFVQSNAILCHLALKTQAWGTQSTQLWQQNLEWLFWEANKIGLCLPQIRAHHLFESSRLQLDALAWLTARYEHDVGIIEETLADGRSFITGDQIAVADVSMSGYLFYAEQAKVDVPANVEQWLQNIAALPGWRAPAQLLHG